MKPERQRPKTLLDKAKGYEILWDHVANVLSLTTRFANPSYVYMIGEHEDEGPVKIGVAKDPIARLRDMQVGNPRRLRVERLLVGDREIEKLLHAYWEPFRIVAAGKRQNPTSRPGTEWFKPEIRGELFPIVETAAPAQLRHIFDCPDDVELGALEKIVREAHIAHDFVLKMPDEVRLLARSAGYVSFPAGRLAS